MIRDYIQQDFQKVLSKLKIPPSELVLEHPNNPNFGDYSTNIALKIQNPEFTNPVDWANHIVNTWRTMGLPDYLSKIEVAKPGFINLWLRNEVFINQLEEVLKTKDKFGKLDLYRGKKILLEHTSPNPQTTIMLGHLRNNFLGMAVARLLEFGGAKVSKDCIVNDRGVHICRSIWGYLVFGSKKSSLNRKRLANFREITDQQIQEVIAKAEWQKLLEQWSKKKIAWLTPENLKLKPDHANLIWYVLGSRAYGLSEDVHKQVEEILIEWEKENNKVRKIWRQILEWSAKGYAQTYKRIGSVHDWVWYEADHYRAGKKIVEEGFKKDVFKASEGAVVTDLAKYNLPDTIVQKTDGTALYMTQDLALTKLKRQKFPSDLYIWTIGEEQSLYFKQLFAVCEQLGIGKKKDFLHLSYALINFKRGGKMATRKGDVVMADEVLDEIKKRALEVMRSSNQELRGKMKVDQLNTLAEKVALAAVKYSLLKFGRETTIYFDIDASLSLEGDSGPYLQYTYARCRSVLKKSKVIPILSGQKLKVEMENRKFEDEELGMLRTIYRFPEVVEQAIAAYSPNLISAFLFDLAQKYNLMYNKLPILKSEGGNRTLRLGLTEATAQVIKTGLGLLGIETVERM